MKRQGGRPCGTLLGEVFLAHRIIWKMVYGENPDTIDHINGDPSDNRLSNLRNVTQAENNKNKAMFRKNKSGHPGVVQVDYGMWKVQIGTKYIGCYADLETAIAARAEAEEAANYHENHGRART